MMKKILLLLLSVFISLSLTACGTGSSKNGQSSPTGATGLFIAAIEEENYVNAESYLTEDAFNMYGEIGLKEFHEKFTKDEGRTINDVDSSKTEITGDSAIVPIYWTDYNNTVNYKINLIKEGDGWLIQSISEY